MKILNIELNSGTLLSVSDKKNIEEFENGIKWEGCRIKISTTDNIERCIFSSCVVQYWYSEDMEG
jgi:hypothetical protein